MRERLIELILECSTFTPEYARQARLHAEYVAQHLLNAGVIVPPCKVGQTVWFISEFYAPPFQTVITSIEVYEEETVICTLSGTEWHYEDFGKTVFLIKEEAEQALAERSKQ